MNEEPNTFLRNPLRVALYNPPLLKKSRAIECIYITVGNVPNEIITAIKTKNEKTLRDYYGPQYAVKLGMNNQTDVIGGGEFDDIERLLAQDVAKPAASTVSAAMNTAAQACAGVNYNFDIFVYPEDKMSELKDKIFILSGIPAYRQHLFYINAHGLQQLYRIHIDGAYDVDIRDISAQESIFGIPVDKRIYAAREQLHVEAFDALSTLDNTLDLTHTVYVVDLANFIKPIHAQLQERIIDKYYTDLFYYGFIFKYWPHFSRDAYIEYLRSETEFNARYPDLCKPRQVITQQCRSEAAIINDKYNRAAKIRKWADSNISISITNMTAFMPSTKAASINIRNLFDKLRVSAIIPEIHARIVVNHVTYILRKRHIRNGSEISFPTTAQMREGLTIAISLRKHDQETFHEKQTFSTMENEMSRYLFLAIHPSGKYYVRTVWNEEDSLSFEDVTALIKRFVDPIIKGINSLGRYVFITGRELPLISSSVLQFETLSICIYWRKVVQEDTFKLIRKHWEPFLSARIVAPRNVMQMEKYELLFRKGMYDFDTVGIDRIVSSAKLAGDNNQYAYLTNGAIRQKWEQNYDGRVVRMYHRSSDIKFEAVNIRRGEFESFYGFIVYFSFTAAQISAVKSTISHTSDAQRKLNKLKEVDPELFNLKKHGVNYQYSVKCQKPRQPTIFSEYELKSMPADERKKLVKYWNFTAQKPAWYGCPSRKYPHLSFIVGVHPKHYCLPCCNKKGAIDNSNREIAKDKCLAEHMFVVEKKTVFTPHVMVYGKKLDIGRVSHVPAGNIKYILGANCYVCGVEQRMPNIKRIGLVFAAAMALNITTAKMFDTILTSFKASPQILGTYMGGKLLEHFPTVDSIIGAIENLFVAGRQPTRDEYSFTQWNELFVEIFLRIFGVHIITILDASGAGDNLSVYISPEQLDIIADNNIILVLKQVNDYYPIFEMDTVKYFRTGAIITRVFSAKTSVAKNIRKLAEYAVAGGKYAVGKVIDLHAIKQCAVIEKIYINRQNYCYAVLCSINGHAAYIPVEYCHYSPSDNPTWDTEQHVSTSQDLKAVISAINAHIREQKIGLSHYAYREITPQKIIMRAGKLIGVLGSYNDLYRVSDTSEYSTLPVEELGYDVDKVNKLIYDKAAPTIDARTTKYGSAMWNNYSYILFVVEFIGFIENERDTAKRQSILQLIRAADLVHGMKDFKKQLATLVTDVDLATLYGQLLSVYFVDYNVADLIQAVNTTVYEFDRLTVSKLLVMTHSERVSNLLTLSAAFTEEKPTFEPPVGMSFPNVYLPCSDLQKNNQWSFCEGVKLIVTNRKEYCEYLSRDLADPLRCKQMLSATWADTVVDPLKFIQSPSEIISVYKLI